MKPRIVKVCGSWTLVYGYHPRMMWLFGLSAEEREQTKQRCVTHEHFDSWAAAIAHLRQLYYLREIRRA